MFWIPLLVVGIWVLDRLTKIWVLKHFFLGESRPILPFFNLTYVQNTGVAFGLGQRFNALFIVTTLILTTLLLVWQRREKANLLMKLSIGLLIAGALGNLYDRVAYGGVVDFLDFYFGSYHWPSFNVADSSVCIGALLLLLRRRGSA